MKLSLAFLLLLTLTSFSSDKPGPFTGKILYKYSFTDLKGNDMTNPMATMFGREQHYLIDRKNYKAYDEKGDWMQLYNSETNTYYYFKNKMAMRYDAAEKTNKKHSVTKLNLKEEIAGYSCKAIEVKTESTTTVYYYSEDVSIDSRPFEKHHFGNWSSYLKATNGALPLKFVLTNKERGYVWTSTATAVIRQVLEPSEFTFPEGITVR